MSLTNLFLLLHVLVCPSSQAQEKVLESEVPDSKRAFLVLEIKPATFLNHPVLKPFFGAEDLGSLGIPVEAGIYRSVQKVVLYLGNPGFRGDTEFVCRINVNNKAVLPNLVNQMFGLGGRQLETVQEDGWTVCKARFLEVVRYKDDLLEFGSSVYTGTPTNQLVSENMRQVYDSMDENAGFCLVVSGPLTTSFFEKAFGFSESEEEAVYEMLKRGRLVNDLSLFLYSIKLLSDLEVIGLTGSLESKVIAELKLVPQKGNEEIVKARAKVIHDFLVFHMQLPIRTLKEKEKSVAKILEEFVSCLQYSVEDGNVKLTLTKPAGIDESLAAIMRKIKGSFAEKEDLNRMKMLGLAAHNYHDTFNRFPQAPQPARAKPFHKNLSWRVKVLPFIEYDQAYNAMDLSKPWDAKVNQAVIPKCQDAFVLSNGAQISGILVDPLPISFGQILDGSSNTIMFMENRKAAMTPWTKPQDLTIDEAVKAVANLEKGDFLYVTFYDGSVARLPSLQELEITEKELRNAFDPRDGNFTDIHEAIENTESSLFPKVRRSRSIPQIEIKE